MADSGGGSSLTVLLAMGANVGVGVAKGVAGVLTGSGAMLSESAHSLGDTMNEVLLYTALKRSEKPPDRLHPFGYGRERYFWSLLAAVAIFTSGALFSLYQGVTTILHGEEQQDVTIAFVVLGIAFVLEGISFVQAVRQVGREKQEHRVELRTWLRRTDDPTIATVLFEDGTALLGLILAFGGLALTHLTGSPVWDGAASIAIGVLLIGVAYGLGRMNRALIVGQGADPRLVDALTRWLHERPEVDDVVDLLTMINGTDQILVCARVDFAEDMSSGGVEEACVRLDADLREEFADLAQIFIEPVPSGDPEMRARARARLGS
jgi:cation diffusion facilitator family transporter